jgi:release factor glutamine methyltransferase
MSAADPVRALASAGIANASREARLLRDLAGNDAAKLADFVRRRAAGEPYSRIRGAREFWSLDLALSPDTLDPRPDSETLIEAALAWFSDRTAPLRAVDFGSGSGALLLAFLSEYPKATGIGIDILPGAVATARRNAEGLGLAPRARFVQGDWAAMEPGEADVVLANPPYVPSREIELLAPEVARFDPRTALDGGADGLDAYRALAPAIRASLAASGVALVELGAGQAQAVAAIMRGAGLDPAGLRHDLAGIPRCLAIR